MLVKEARLEAAVGALRVELRRSPALEDGAAQRMVTELLGLGDTEQMAQQVLDLGVHLPDVSQDRHERRLELPADRTQRMNPGRESPVEQFEDPGAALRR